MKARNRLLAAAAVPALVGAGLLGAGSAQAATGYTDTSVQVSNFIWSHQIVGTATDSTALPSTVDVTGLHGAFAPGDPTSTTVKYAITAGADVDGVILSVTDNEALHPGFTTGVISADGHLNAGAVAPVQAVVTLTATDSYGDVAVVTVPVAVGTDTVGEGTASVLTDEVYQITGGDTNPNGSVTFAAKDTSDVPVTSIGEGNLPAGLTSGNPLLPGTAVPGSYKDMLATATDSSGARATGSFLLKVNGGKTPAAPVPVLSHGSAAYVAATRENVYFDTTISTWVHFQIVGPGAINGHEGWVYAVAGQLNAGVYSGLEANHGYTVYYTPVTGKGGGQIVGTHTGYVYFISNRK